MDVSHPHASGRNKQVGRLVERILALVRCGCDVELRRPDGVEGYEVKLRHPPSDGRETGVVSFFDDRDAAYAGWCWTVRMLLERSVGALERTGVFSPPPFEAEPEDDCVEAGMKLEAEFFERFAQGLAIGFQPFGKGAAVALRRVAGGNYVVCKPTRDFAELRSTGERLEAVRMLIGAWASQLPHLASAPSASYPRI